MSGVLHDLRFAARTLRRQPGITAAAVVCLALGIGANTTAYSALDALLLHTVPAADDRGLVMLAEASADTERDYDLVAPATLDDWRRASRTIGDVAAGRWHDVNLTGGDRPERVTSYQVEPALFALLGARPRLGRVFTDDGRTSGAPGAVLGEALWRSRFGADPAVVGRTVLLDGAPHVVTGVLDADFIFPPGAQLWTPLRLTPAEAAERGTRSLRAIGRLRPGVSLAEARAELRTIAARVAAEHPATNRAWTARVEDANASIGADRRPYLLAMQLSTGLVLLIACVNVANLLLARASTRGREVAVRVALGAGRGRLARQFLAEALLLAVLGGLAGVLVALWGTLALRVSLPAELLRYNPGWTRIGVNANALGFTAIVALVTGVLFGFAPALLGTRQSPGAILRGGRAAAGAPPRLRARSALVVVQLALATALLVTTTLALRTFVHLTRADAGFDARPLLTMQLSLPEAEYDDSAAVRFYERLGARVGALPGVAAVGAVNVLPMEWFERATSVRAEGREPVSEHDATPTWRTRVVDAGYFAALGVPLLDGRALRADDRAGAVPVVVVSAAAARQLWPGEHAIGRRLRLGRDATLREVVGVVGDVRHNPNMGLDPLHPIAYLPLAQRPTHDLSLVIRVAAGEPTALAAAVQREISALDRGLAAGEVATMPRILFAALSPQRATAGMFAIMGAIALVLAVVGVYGVIAYATAQRTHELGVRVALGATRGSVVRLVLRRGLWLTAAGILLGAVGAYATAQSMAGILRGVSPTDVPTYAGAAALLAAVSLLAAYLPARRAARVAPSVALRAE